MIEQIIITEVSEHFGIPEEQMRSHDRHRDIAEARFFAMLFLREYTRLGLRQVGALVGNGKAFDHASVVHGVKTAKNLIAYNGYRKHYEAIRQRVEMQLQAVSNEWMNRIPQY